MKTKVHLTEKDPLIKISSIFILVMLIPALYACNLKNEVQNGSEKIRNGEIVTGIACVADSSVRYTLYIPGSMPESGKPALLICFDPHATGQIPVKLFKAEAEKSGFILAGSENSRNGMTREETSAFYRKMLADLKSRFEIDPKAIYLAGFSGGSRVAGGIALTEADIAGVIGCGAGLPGSSSSPVHPFSYLAVGGTADFNLNELRQQDEMLENAGYVHHLLTFDGPHAWPPEDLSPLIFTWLKFDRMRTGSLPVDRNRLNAFIDKYYNEAEKYGSEGNLLNQVSVLKMMGHFLNGLTDLTPLQDEIKRLEETTAVIKKYQEQKENQEKEARLQSQYSEYLQTRDLLWWKPESVKLKKLSENTLSKDESLIYKRLMGYLSLNSYMLAGAAIRQNDMNAASGFIEKYRMIDPSNNEHRYMAATVAVIEGQTEKALFELEQAKKLGFNDITRLENDPVFSSLRNDPRLKQLFQQQKK